MIHYLLWFWLSG